MNYAIQLENRSAKAICHDNEQEIACSTGKQKPVVKVPMLACDCHHHIYDPAQFPYSPDDKRKQPPSTVSSYRLLQKRLGISRNVIVQPSAYGTDNSCTLAALQEMGPSARAIVVVDESVSDAELRNMHDLGVRGIRLNLASEQKVIKPDGIERLSARIHELGWHVQFWTMADDIVDMEEILKRMTSPMVFDHLGHLPQPSGVNHPAFKVICNLIEKGSAWVKLSGPYHDSEVGAPSYSDSTKLAQAYVKFAPERLVWGSDWPHPIMYSKKKEWPDDAQLLDLLAQWAPDDAIREKILVDNPAILYGYR